jgi:hypothetical protein
MLSDRSASTAGRDQCIFDKYQYHLVAAAGLPRREGAGGIARSAPGWGRHSPGPLMERSSCKGVPSGDGGSADVHRRLVCT